MTRSALPVAGAGTATRTDRIIRSVPAPFDLAQDDDDRAAVAAAHDAQSMLAYAAGDAAAFAALYARHERPLYRFLLRSVGGQAATADDLLQDVWLAVVRNAATWEPRARFATWLYGIARNRLIDHWRARRVHVSLDAADNELDPGAAALVDRIAADRTAQPEVRIESRAHAQAFIAAVEQLPAAQRETFLLHAEGELTLMEIAQLTGVGTETAKSRLRYAMVRLRQAMEAWQ